MAFIPTSGFGSPFGSPFGGFAPVNDAKTNKLQDVTSLVRVTTDILSDPNVAIQMLEDIEVVCRKYRAARELEIIDKINNKRTATTPVCPGAPMKKRTRTE